MFFDDQDERFFREFYAFSSNIEVTPFGLRSVPTHTEDGIPIRKLYVSNLPPKTTRSELFGVFAQYGFIKSCWLRMAEKGFNRSPSPTYAFVTFSNPDDAHKALQAPHHEKMLRGRSLRISPADSWHQPAEEADGRVVWKPRGIRHDDTDVQSNDDTQPDAAQPETSSNNSEATSSEASEIVETSPIEEDGEPCYTILDVLNRDCLSHVLSYVPLRDIVRSEQVSKGWQDMVHEYLASIRTYKTSWWAHEPVTLTTAVLRRLLGRLGDSLLRLHIDHHWSALNDRTAHSVGKFCPNLEELKVVGMHTKNWNPIVYGCKQLKTLSFVSCNKLTDSSLVQLVKNDSCIESLTIANNTHVTGLFLTGTNPHNLSSLAFYNCYSLQGTVLSAAIDTLPNLTTLKLDVCPVTMWKIIPLILNKLPKLQELSLSEYTSIEICLTPHVNDAFCECLPTLKELKSLNLSRNIYITNAVLKQVAQSCPLLETLNVSSCNSRKFLPVTEVSVPQGVGDEGVNAVCRGCSALRRLDVSYLAALSDAGATAAARLTRLEAITARGLPALTAAPFAAVLAACPRLQEVDVCGCDNVSEEVVFAGARALSARPRALLLRLAGTAAAGNAANGGAKHEELPRHPLLTVDLDDDLCNQQLRPDFVERVYDSSDDSFDDMYDHEFGFLGEDDDIYLDEDDEDLDDGDEFNLYAYGLHGPDIILL